MRLESLAEAQARTEQALQELTAVVRGLYLRRARVLQPADLLDEVEAKLDRPEVQDELRADLLAQGLVACESIHPQTIPSAREQGVRVWAGGRFVDENEAASWACVMVRQPDLPSPAR